MRISSEVKPLKDFLVMVTYGIDRLESPMMPLKGLLLSILMKVLPNNENNYHLVEQCFEVIADLIFILPV